MWGTGALVVQVLMQRHGFTPENISFWRFVVGAIVLVAVFARRGVWQTLKPLLGTVFIAGTAMGGSVLLWFYGIERAGAAVPTLIAICLPPVFVTLVSLWRGQEKPGWLLFTLLAVSLVGTVLLVQHQDADADAPARDMALGVTFAVSAALFQTVFMLANGKLSNALGAGPAAMGLTVVAVVMMGLFGFVVLHQPLRWPTDVPPQAWFLYLGIVTAALALLAFSWGAARLSPTLLTIAALVEPLTTVLLAALLLGERLSLLQWLGGALLLASIWALGQREAARHLQRVSSAS
jgi:DME family drug/metabolite transporter